MADVFPSTWFNEHWLSETCFAKKCWFFSGLWNYWHDSMASRFMAEFHCFVLGCFVDYCFYGNSWPSEVPCSGVLPCRPCLQHCAGCCSFRISSVAGQSNFGWLVGPHFHFSWFILGSLLQSAWSLAQRYCFAHFALHWVFWSGSNSWNYLYVEHDELAGLGHLAAPSFGDVDDVLVERSCSCSRWHFCRSKPHFDWVQVLLSSSDCRAPRCSGFLLFDEIRGLGQSLMSDSVL